MLKTFNKALDHLEELIIMFLIAVATLIIFVAVVHRFCSGVPALQPYTAKINMSWAQELCIFMFVWMAKFGAAFGVRAGTHVGVDVLTNRLHGNKRKYLITAGLLGSWGEWHTYPRRDLWANAKTQTEVMDAYEAAFKKTPVLLRYPAGEGDREGKPAAGGIAAEHDLPRRRALLQHGVIDPDGVLDLRGEGVFRRQPVVGNDHPGIECRGDPQGEVAMG